MKNKQKGKLKAGMGLLFQGSGKLTTLTQKMQSLAIWRACLAKSTLVISGLLLESPACTQPLQ